MYSYYKFQFFQIIVYCKTTQMLCVCNKQVRKCLDGVKGLTHLLSLFQQVINALILPCFSWLSRKRGYITFHVLISYMARYPILHPSPLKGEKFKMAAEGPHHIEVCRYSCKMYVMTESHDSIQTSSTTRTGSLVATVLGICLSSCT
jgi:hypothetical protein